MVNSFRFCTLEMSNATFSTLMILVSVYHRKSQQEQSCWYSVAEISHTGSKMNQHTHTTEENNRQDIASGWFPSERQREIKVVQKFCCSFFCISISFTEMYSKKKAWCSFWPYILCSFFKCTDMFICTYLHSCELGYCSLGTRSSELITRTHMESVWVKATVQHTKHGGFTYLNSICHFSTPVL